MAQLFPLIGDPICATKLYLSAKRQNWRSWRLHATPFYFQKGRSDPRHESAFKRPDGTFAAASGSLDEISLALVNMSDGLTRIFTVNLGGVLAAVREAATRAQVDLGTFETHDDYVAWRVAVGRHQQQCEDRLKTRRLPGPPRAKAKKRRKRVQEARQAESKMQERA